MRAPFVLIPQYFGSLVFCRFDARYIPFDSGATELLKRLTALRIDEILADRRLSASRQETIRRFYDFFESQGWFAADGRFAAEVLDVTCPADHMVGPLAVHLEITDRCNLRCSHCFAGDASPSGSSDALTLGEIDRLFVELAGIGSYRIGLTGGEPFMRHDLLEIIRAALVLGLHPCVTTNGLLITDSVARDLARLQPLRLNVSLEGATAEVNDTVRGRGTFDQVLGRIGHLRRNGVPFGLSFTLTRSNARQIQHCAELARRCGADAAVFRPLYPVGRAARTPELMPTYDQYADALRQLAASKDETGRLYAIDPFSPDIRENAQARIYGGPGCGAGNLVASISVDGHVNPCGFLGTGLNSGNLRDSSFSDIWHSGEAFTRLRAARPTSDFSGGCRARALAFGGSIDAADPWHDEYMKNSASMPFPQSVCELTQ